MLEHKNDAQQYSALKETSTKERSNIQSYTTAKENFVNSIIARAKELYKNKDKMHKGVEGGL